MSTAEERAFLDAISVDYAWAVTGHLVRGGRIVGGTPKSREAARWIQERMIRDVGLPAEHVGLEEFPVVGYDIDEAVSGDSVGFTRLEISLEGLWEDVAAAQILKGRGTGPSGVAGAIVDVGNGRLEDFERVDVRGKIVLFTATDVLFYGAPVQQTARQRGAVGAIMHWPVAPDDALRLHTMAGILPLVSIRNVDAARIRMGLSHGPVHARLVVDNHWDGEPRRVGYNVVGMIPGTEHPDEFIYLAAHFDHWFTAAADDCAGVGSLLSIAKGFVEAGLRPRRTIVFVVFDAEELGGWGDSWYDWLIGSYSHIVETLTGPGLHSDRCGKLVAMLNMDVVGTRGAEVILECTPELTPFLLRAAEDSGLRRAVSMRVSGPPTSYDDWPFYQAGIPASQVAWWGPAYDPLYHTDRDTLETLDPENVRLNTAFHGLAVLRAAQSRVHPYDFRETVRCIDAVMAPLRAAIPPAELGGTLPALEGMRAAFEAAVSRLETSLRRDDVDVNSLNRSMREAIRALNPHLFVWDFLAPLPGWGSVPRSSNPLNDLEALRRAIDVLRRGDGATALDAMRRVATMQWGQFMDGEGYRRLLAYVAAEDTRHMLWGLGFVPPLTDVHGEFESVREKVAVGAREFAPEAFALEEKMRRIPLRLLPFVSELTHQLSVAAHRLEAVS